MLYGTVMDDCSEFLSFDGINCLNLKEQQMLTAMQKELIAKNGTVEEYTDRLINLLAGGGRTSEEALADVRKYREEFRKAGNQLKASELTDEDAANIGRALMERLPDGYSWSDSPTEIVTDLLNQIHDLKNPVKEPVSVYTCTGMIRVPLEATPGMLRAGTDLCGVTWNETLVWDFLSKAWPVMVTQFAKDAGIRSGIRDDVHELITFLSSLAEIDPIAMGALVNHRVPCNIGILMHPTVQTGLNEATGETGESGEVGILGILNGYAGKFRDGKYVGWGPIAAVMEKDGRVTSFQFTELSLPISREEKK
jgi:hypothetical protein